MTWLGRGGWVAIGILLAPSTVWAGEVNLADGVAISGYDPVAYFTSGKAVHGDPAITATHDGATYRFASGADRALFVADPARYEPQFGGFCAFGTAEGHKATIDPEAFTIIGGKLYLNYNQDVWATFKQDPQGYIRKAEANWPTVREQPDPAP